MKTHTLFVFIRVIRAIRGSIFGLAIILEFGEYGLFTENPGVNSF
jgi:hypothetical protein